MSFKVLIPQDITDPGKDYLKEHGCEIEVLDDHSVENICKHVVDADETSPSWLVQRIIRPPCLRQERS